ncbi:DUF72 domain-containing protein [Desulfohalovibrio reitneri]|uniref:DUF72 domain-containing protein n=1 Tax=Desulfohalovibrio reitneri TaxID=1307759 RepID=UPI0004A6FABE|nr:DUF72 domain-containing protein [Desulfohalovibrio reitneri]
MSEILTGTCGFAEAQDDLFGEFDCLEVQRSFYQPPMAKTAAKWRDKAGEDFVFSLKAWQLITHASSSPTYRKLSEDLSQRQIDQCGGFKWNDTTRMAWNRTLAIAKSLRAETIVFQCPSSFHPGKRELDRMRRFFSEAPREGMQMVFEPRGEGWTDELVSSLVMELDLVHAADPFIRQPTGRGLRYFRLHGRPAYNTRHEYSEDELYDVLRVCAGQWPNRVYFNNQAMVPNARQFKKLVNA